MKRLKVHVLFEYGINYRPHASASLRLIRPLSYPGVSDQIEITFGYDLVGIYPDLVLVDRFWRPNVQPSMVQELADETRHRGAKLIYWLDDNFLKLTGKREIAPKLTESTLRFLELSDGLVVSTAELKEAFPNKPHVVFLPSALDERLIVRKPFRRTASGKLVIGYMGTPTHDDDFDMVLPALRAVNARYPGRLLFQLIGVQNNWQPEDWEKIGSLPVEVLRPQPSECEYQLFMVWFTGTVRWDIAIAPLVDSQFNRFKSDIKFLDYTAASAPGIFSQVPAYTSTIENRRTGLLVPNITSAWGQALEEMIEDSNFRASLIGNANQYLFQNRVLAKCAENWVRTIFELKNC